MLYSRYIIFKQRVFIDFTAKNHVHRGHFRGSVVYRPFDRWRRVVPYLLTRASTAKTMASQQQKQSSIVSFFNKRSNEGSVTEEITATEGADTSAKKGRVK